MVAAAFSQCTFHVMKQCHIASCSLAHGTLFGPSCSGFPGCHLSRISVLHLWHGVALPFSSHRSPAHLALGLWTMLCCSCYGMGVSSFFFAALGISELILSSRRPLLLPWHCVLVHFGARLLRQCHFESPYVGELLARCCHTLAWACTSCSTSYSGPLGSSL